MKTAKKQPRMTFMRFAYLAAKARGENPFSDPRRTYEEKEAAERARSAYPRPTRDQEDGQRVPHRPKA